MKKQNKVISLIVSAFLLLAGFGEIISVNAEDVDENHSCTFENLTITTNDGSALTYGTAVGDYDVYSNGKVLYINTNKAVTVTGTTTTATLAIAKGTKADVTFNNVSITNTAAAPVDVIANNVSDPTTLHLTLADGSTNTLNAGTGPHAGIHVAYGAKLIIDDSVKNWAEVEGGRIVDEYDDKGVQKPAWLMDSKNPGTLTVRGGYFSAGIGGQASASSTSAGQNSGAIVINGGNIIASAPYANQNWSGGSGIGGSSYGGAGCHLDGGGIIINGGNIDATASYHGSGIGGGWHAGDIPGVGNKSTATGDITINGGYVKATGKDHGNAFGGACGQKDNVGHGATGASHKITITGGTLLPQATSSGWYGVGAQKANVIVTGGSFYPTNTANSSANGGAGITGASVVSADGTNLTMVKIAIGAMEDVEVGDKIYDFTVTVDGKPLSDTEGNFINYGLANRVAADQTLYFWLPTSATGKSVSISNVTLMKSDGRLIKAEYPFSLPSVGTGDTTKRWVTFEVDTDKFSNELKGLLSKTYDGLGWNPKVLAGEIVSQNIVLPEPADAKIDKEDQLNFSSVRIKDWFGNATSDSSTTGEISTTGTYTITVNYDEFKSDPKFSQSFWGHQTTLKSVISPANSQITNLKTNSTWQDETHSKFATITLTADVLPAKGEAKTCAAPDGTVQFYINGVKVGKPVKVTEVTKPEEDSEDYAYSTATLTIDFIKDSLKYPIPELADGTFQVEAQYLGGTNYNLAEKRATVTEETSPEEFPFITPPTPVIDPDDGEDEDKPIIIPDSFELEGDEDKPILHGYAKDSMNVSVVPNKTMNTEEFKEMFGNRYGFVNKAGAALETEISEFEVQNSDKEVVTEVDLSKVATYTIIATVTDKQGNKTTIKLAYNLIRLNVDVDGDGEPDINIDTDGDGKPDINIDTDGDNKPDINIDTDKDGEPDVNIVDKDGDGEPDKNIDPDSDVKPDVNIDTDGDGKPDINVDTDGDGKPDINIIDKDGDGKPDKDIDPSKDKEPNVNIDTDGDGEPDVNVDTDGDGKPDVNIDTDGDGKPDINVDTDGDGEPDVNIVDKDGDGKPDKNIDPDSDVKPDINVDTDGDGKPDVNIDTDGDGKPDVNIVDKDGDGKPDKDIDPDSDVKPDINVDTDNDGKPDVNIDTDGDGKPDVNIVDKDGDGKPDKDIDPDSDVKPDINVDTDKDGLPDVNIDTDGDGKPDVNIVDKDGDGKPDKDIDPDSGVKPDINVDTTGDGKPNINIDTDGDGKPDINIVDKDGDGKPDKDIDPDSDVKPDVNIDTDGDNKPDVNIDTTGDGKPNLNVDTDGDGEPDINIDTDGDGKPDLNIDEDGDGKPDKNIDRDGDGKVDIEVQGDDFKDNHLQKVKTSDEALVNEMTTLAVTSLFVAILALVYKRKED